MYQSDYVHSGRLKQEQDRSIQNEKARDRSANFAGHEERIQALIRQMKEARQADALHFFMDEMEIAKLSPRSKRLAGSAKGKTP